MSITIVGLGPGNRDYISRAALEALCSAKKIYFRTKKHPIMEWLTPRLGAEIHFCDDLYMKQNRFEKVYDAITHRIVTAGFQEDIVYAVPGHPNVAEKTTALIEARSKECGVPCRTIPSMSFVDALFHALSFDPSKGFQLVDALEFEELRLDVQKALIVTQVYDGAVASQVKLKLMRQYSDEQDVYFVQNAGADRGETVKILKLYELDHSENHYDHLTCIFLPGLSAEEKKQYDLSDLRRVMEQLRGETGCLWDKRQDHISLIPYMREECEEAIEAIEAMDTDEMRKELGDVLWQVVFHSRIEEEEGYFDLADVIDGITRKMIYRHPHVFAGHTIENEEELRVLWNRLKTEEN